MKRQNRHRNQQRSCGRRRAVLGITVVPVLLLASSANAALDSDTQQAMIAAINDEYQARAFYTAVIEKFGSVRPFSHIVQAETRHAERWQAIFRRYGLPIPEDTFMGQVEAPETLKLACQMGIDAEIANVEMYDRFLEFVQEEDLRTAFSQLREVSQTRHLPAFQRCVARFS